MLPKADLYCLIWFVPADFPRRGQSTRRSAWRVDEVRKRRRYCQQKPCGFAAALGRRQRVAHNSTGPTSL